MRNLSSSRRRTVAVVATAAVVGATAAAAIAVAAPARSAPAARAPVARDDDRAGEVVRVAIVSRVGDGAIDDQPKHARKGEVVTLYALAEIRRGDRTLWLGDVGDDDGRDRDRAAATAATTPPPVVMLAGRRITPHPWREGPPVHLAWNRVEPALATMSNTASGTFAFEPIEYRATAIAGADDRTTLVADVRPSLTPDHGDGVGTMRFQIVLRAGARTIASPGADARRGRGSGGLVDGVHRISVRRDDSYLGYLTELYGQPYIWASAGTSDASHQSERLEGADCADFVVYGARRLGLRVPYTWTAELPRYTRTLAHGAPDADGVYRDDRGDAIAFPAVGDLVLFPRHVGVLVEDRGRRGVLDDQDVIMHALFDTPKEVAIADSGYAGTPIQVLRWPRPPRR